MATTITVLSQKGGTGKTTADYLALAEEVLARADFPEERARAHGLRTEVATA